MDDISQKLDRVLAPLGDILERALAPLVLDLKEEKQEDSELQSEAMVEDVEEMDLEPADPRSSQLPDWMLRGDDLAWTRGTPSSSQLYSQS